MKRFLLVGLISLFGFISFSNAGSLTCNGYTSQNKCSSCDYLIGDYYCCVNVPSNTEKVVISSTSNNFGLSFDGDSRNNNYSFPYTLNVNDNTQLCVYYGYGTLSFDFKSYPTVTEQALPAVITGLSTVLGEFIPYVIYIGLGVLIVSIAFVAVKWLMLWIYNKVKFIFKKR